MRDLAKGCGLGGGKGGRHRSPHTTMGRNPLPGRSGAMAEDQDKNPPLGFQAESAGESGLFVPKAGKLGSWWLGLGGPPRSGRASSPDSSSKSGRSRRQGGGENRPGGGGAVSGRTSPGRPG